MNKSEWISVDERLPDSNRDVLLTDGDSIVVGFMAQWGWAPANVCFDLNGSGEIVFDIRGEITHWMPLPEPPEIER